MTDKEGLTVSEYEDKEIVCIDCKAKFVFTAGEQDFFAQRGFTPPKRCKTCREVRKASRSDHSNMKRPPQDDVRKQSDGSPPPAGEVAQVFVPDERRHSRKRRRPQEGEDYREVWESPRKHRREKGE